MQHAGSDVRHKTLYVPCRAHERHEKLAEAADRLKALHVGDRVSVVAEERDTSLGFLQTCVDPTITDECEYLEVVHEGCSASVTYHLGDDLSRELQAMSAQPRTT